MVERCRCGAELLGSLHFCVGCGRPRAQAVVPRPRTGAVQVGAPVPQGRNPAQHPSAARYRPAAQYRPVDRYCPAAPASAPSVRAGPQPTVHAPGWDPPAGWGPVAPAPSRTPWVVASLVLVTLLLAGAALLVLRPDLLPGTAPTVTPAAAPVPVVVAPAAAPVVIPPTTSVPGYTPSPTTSLTEQAAADSPRVAATAGYWVPQLSSKRAGTSDGGITYDEQGILDHYRGLAAQYPGAALVWSGDWPVFRNSDYWVVVVARPFTTAAGANAWCDAQGFGSDDCFAKKISWSDGPQGSTVHR
ncbi:hypothetical protein HX744_01920 [Pseudonocardia sp. ICBG1122]|nr:hypothetical protein [Pseudonocardia pini]